MGDEVRVTRAVRSPCVPSSSPFWVKHSDSCPVHGPGEGDLSWLVDPSVVGDRWETPADKLADTYMDATTGKFYSLGDLPYNLTRGNLAGISRGTVHPPIRVGRQLPSRRDGTLRGRVPVQRDYVAVSRLLRYAERGKFRDSGRRGVQALSHRWPVVFRVMAVRLRQVWVR